VELYLYFPLCFHDIHRENFVVLFISIYLFIYLQFFKDTVTISNCVMSDSRIIVKCLWLYVMSIQAFVWVNRGAMQFLVQDNQCLD
jgi:hypothetical protein